MYEELLESDLFVSKAEKGRAIDRSLCKFWTLADNMFCSIELPCVAAGIPSEFRGRRLLCTFKGHIAEIWNEFLLDMLVYGFRSLSRACHSKSQR